LLLLLICFSPQLLQARSASSPAYEDELVEKALNSLLHEERYWHVLLHYKKELLGTKSLIDDSKFFLSSNGKKDPEAELEATIRGFFRTFLAEEDHPLCRYPARYEWLKDELGIDESMLPEVSCAEMDKTFSKVKPESAVLVFPAAFMNSPASMFGHTLIRIDSSNESKLLSYAVNYAARTAETSGFAFAFKGIFGFYPGYYSVLPYYEKVKEYNNMRDRDMWEYTLSLTREEVRRMLLHIWEMKEVYSDYYFFDENCSYNLLFLIEAARPSLRLTDSFFYWVVPVETIKAINNEGLIRSKRYRPSISTKIRHLMESATPDVREIAIKRGYDEIMPAEITDLDFTADKKTLALDMATEIIQYRYARNDITKKEYNAKFLANLSVRSTFGISPTKEGDLKPPSAPEKGHDSSRFSIGSGDREGESFAELSFRPAYHTLLDPDEGYLEGSQVVFGDMTVRYYDQNYLKLESLDVIDLFSLSPRDGFFKPLSWKVKTGIKSRTLPTGEHHLFYLNPGFGLTYKSKWLGLYYVMAEFDMDFSKHLDYGYSIGGGVSAGFVKNISDYWKVLFRAKATSFKAGETYNLREYSLIQNFKINHSNGLTVSCSRNETFDVTRDEGKVNWNIYF
ncbi:MAG: DUF4105 domain-containing protein, partial [Spirochaetes bacterium]|nr:DUF4105 domain-containing protein [Spirochaetota bacterium]